MIINFDSELMSLNQEPLQSPPQMKGAHMNLKLVCIESLMFNEDGMTGEEKFKNYQLAQRISKGGEVECSAEEITSLKKRIGLAWGTNVVGPAWMLLEQRG